MSIDLDANLSKVTEDVSIAVKFVFDALSGAFAAWCVTSLFLGGVFLSASLLYNAILLPSTYLLVFAIDELLQWVETCHF